MDGVLRLFSSPHLARAAGRGPPVRPTNGRRSPYRHRERLLPVSPTPARSCLWPLVSSYVQLLEMRYIDQLDQDAKEFIDFAVEGVTHMQTLIDDLLAYSRVGTRGKEFVPTAVETALDRALTNLQIRIAESGAVITTDPLPTLNGDSTQLIQLFQNLIGNAIKYGCATLRDRQGPTSANSLRSKTARW